jgi:hypothetical protein
VKPGLIVAWASVTFFGCAGGIGMFVSPVVVKVAQRQTQPPGCAVRRPLAQLAPVAAWSSDGNS